MPAPDRDVESGSASPADSPAPLTARGGRLRALLARFAASEKLRGEAFWVALAHLAVFAANFVLLKFLTSWLSQEEYGEYGLAQSAMLLLLYLTLSPVHEAFLRHYHTAEERGTLGGAGRLLIRWYVTVSVAALALAAMLTIPLGWLLSIGGLTALATAIVFVADRWRSLGIEVLDVRRERGAMGLHTLLFLTAQVLLTIAAVCFVRTAAAALLAWALAAALSALLVVRPLWQRIRAGAAAPDADFRGLIGAFGVPFAALLLCQWVQQSADRYVIAQQLDKAAAGLYVAAYQVCGVPFVLLVSFTGNLVKPIAYQRARDTSDSRQLWAADKVLLGGMAIYAAIGLLCLGAFVVAGPWLVVLLTSSEYRLPGWSIAALAAARYVQMVPMLIQPIFAVHNKMVSSLAFRAIGAAATIPACWAGVALGSPHGTAWAVFGAAAGTALAVALYVLLLVFGPGGCLTLVRESRRTALEQR